MVNKINYKNNYLNDVIFRIDFSNILKLSGNNKDAAEEFRKTIFNKFPEVSFKFNNSLNIKFDSELGKFENLVEDGDLTWVFGNSSNNKEVELNSKFLILHYKKGSYEYFERFLKDVKLVLDALMYYDPFNIKFIELRYINQINMGKDTLNNIKKYINHSLINNFVYDLENTEKLSQILSRVDLIKDYRNLTFQYGFFNPDFPNPSFNKDFILDFDCKIFDKDLPKSKLNIVDEVCKMNEFIHEKLFYSITDELKNMMGVI